jgi:LPS sulfotransferase NodH
MNDSNDTTAAAPADATSSLADTATAPGARQTAVQTGSFVLVAAPRSGSNLLRDLLDQHASIRCLGEIFKDRAINRKQWQRLSGGIAPLNAELRHLRETDVVAFWKTILGKYRVDKPVLGAKIFYHHREGQEIWQYFASSRTPIIHLVREELIDSYLSLMLAEASWLWRQEKGASAETPYERNIVIDLHRFEQYCRKFRRSFDSTEALFKDNPYRRVTYAALVNDRAQTMSGVYSFLDLPDQETSTRLTKQLSRPREEVITNWNEVASFIRANEELCVVR